MKRPNWANWSDFQKSLENLHPDLKRMIIARHVRVDSLSLPINIGESSSNPLVVSGRSFREDLKGASMHGSRSN